ncbi:MAG: flagellar hook-length control protein FliK [Phenylobacterium sp.]
MPPSTGPAPGIGAAASAAQATGPLAGFEAMLAALFGAQGDVAIAGQIGQAATTKPAGAAGALGTDGLNASGDPTATTATDDPDAADAAAAAAAAAAQAACNAALILPIAGQPIAAAAATTETTETAEGSVPAMAPGKSFAPSFATAANGQPVDADAADALGADLDPNAPAAVPATKTATLDPSVAGKLTVPQPATLSAPPEAPAAPQPAAAPLPATPADAPLPSAAAQALAAPQAAVDAKPAGQATPAAPAAPKDKAQASKAGASARIDIAAAGEAKSASAATATSALAANAAGDDDAVHASAAGVAGADAKAEAPETPAGSADAGAATASTTNATTQIHPGAIPVRGAPQTVANLAAQIAKKLDGRSTRFDVQLDPAGLGRVDVRMEIGASGRMTAAMTFDTPQAAAELRARAAELQRHLEQAGFDMSGGLTFDVAGDRGQGRQAQQNQDNDSGQAFRGRAFQEALATAGQADQSAASGALNLRRSLLSGVDIRI